MTFKAALFTLQTTEYGELMVTISTDCRFESFTEAMLNIVDHGSWQRWGARRLGDNEGTTACVVLFFSVVCIVWGFDGTGKGGRGRGILCCSHLSHICSASPTVCSLALAIYYS